MYILGLHFGHDASLALIRDGKIVAYHEKERRTRVKRVVGVTADDVIALLAEAAVSERDLEYVAVTSTQGYQYLFFDGRLNFALDEQSALPSAAFEQHVRLGTMPKETRSIILSRFKSGDFKRLSAARAGPDGGGNWLASVLRPYWDMDPTLMSAFPSIEDFADHPDWKDSASIRRGGWQSRFTRDLALGFHLPIKMSLLGHSVPGILVSHHFAHAAYAHCLSGASRSLIFSLDGGIPDQTSYSSGMVCWGEGARLFPVGPHYLNLGFFYEQSARLLGFDINGSSGKLMGLSSYGKAEFSKSEFGAALHDQRKALNIDGSFGLTDAWERYLKETIRSKGLSWANVGVDESRIMSQESRAVAASTQKIFEDGLTAAVAGAVQGARQSGLRFDKLVMTGGAALNCPGNTAIFRELGNAGIDVLPGVIDSGLSIGAAMALYHAILGNPLPVSRDHQGYLGPCYSEDEVAKALAESAGQVRWNRPDERSYLNEAVTDLLANRIVGWFEGRSEIGPRALGHRSILANPGLAANWKRVNEVKGREWWRPLAPMVLQNRYSEFFTGGPQTSEYMLFTHKVLGERLPAVTHMDGSARVQTVHDRCGRVFKLLTCWSEASGLPALLNTSFNGPGEPIVETPQDSIRCFLERKLDRLYIEGFVVSRM